MNLRESTILLVPGLRDHVPEHWQTHLQKKLANARTVPPLVEAKLSCSARVSMLDLAIATCPSPPLLVAHSAGCIMVAHWAHQYRRQIAGAIMVAPPDLETPMPAPYPTIEDIRKNGWLPIPRRALPFPTVVGASTNDPLASFERVTELAKDWNGKLVNLGDVGHVNPASGFGEWPRAEELIREFLA